jgi:hypothetical protein
VLPLDDLVKRAIELFEQKAGGKFIEHLFGELTFRKTYGAFGEMAADHWMAEAGIDGIDFKPKSRSVPLMS